MAGHGSLTRYEVVRKIARGGMGEVYLARQVGIEGFAKDVVLKRIHSSLAEDASLVSMFLEEARIAALLDHPNIVQIYGLGQQAGHYFIVMEYVPGLSLSRLVKRLDGPMPLSFSLQVAAEVAAGLHFAHNKRDERGEPLRLVHRDVSPPNILLSTAGSVKLTDFGIAKVRWSTSQTQVGVVKGKYSYLSPEQVRGEPADRRSDLYSLGLVLYEMTTGVRAYPLGRETDMLRAVARGVIRPPAELVPDYPEDVWAVLSRAIHPEREERYADCQELQEQLLSLLLARGVVTSPAKLGQYVESLLETPAAKSAEPGASGGEAARPSPAEPATPAPPGSAGSSPGRRGAPLGTIELAPAAGAAAAGAKAEAPAATEAPGTGPTASAGELDATALLVTEAAAPEIADCSAAIDGGAGSITSATGQLVRNGRPSPTSLPLVLTFIGLAATGIAGSWYLLSEDEPEAPLPERVRVTVHPGPKAGRGGAPPTPRAMGISTGPGERSDVTGGAPEAGDGRSITRGEHLGRTTEHRERLSQAATGAAAAGDATNEPNGAAAGTAAATASGAASAAEQSLAAEMVPRKDAAPRSQAQSRRRRLPRGTGPTRADWVSVSLSSDPLTDVYLGRRHLGKTPLTTRLPKTTYETELTFRSRQLGLNTSRKVRIDGTHLSLRYVFNFGRIAFRLPPGRRVEVDGKPRGTTPLPPLVVYEGEHRVVVSDPATGASQTMTVIVRPNLTVSVAHH